MINLKEIEEEIDALLAKETTETLMDWFKNRNKINVECYLGKGELITSGEAVCFVENTSQGEILLPSSNNKIDTGNTQYAMAA